MSLTSPAEEKIKVTVINEKKPLCLFMFKVVICTCYKVNSSLHKVNKKSIIIQQKKTAFNKANCVLY